MELRIARAVCLVAVTAVLALGLGASCFGGPAFQRITKAVQPTLLYVIPVSAMSSAERTMVATLQGIVARSSAEQIYIHPQVGGYENWLQDLVSSYGVTRVDVTDPWWLVSHFQSHLTGYLLYQTGDDSINAATSLAGVESALVVEASLEGQAVAQGLSLVLDLRGLDEAWVEANHGHRLNTVAVFEQKESFEHPLRDYAVLSEALIFYDGNSAFRDTVMGRMRRDSVALGWGDATLGEDQFIGPSSDQGVFPLPADHAHNLAPLSGLPVQQQAQLTHGTPTLEPGVHYASFVMTDGDNVQWLLGDFQSDTRWYGSPLRGSFDMGYGIPPALAVLAPSVMRWYYDNAATGPGRDHFVVGPSGAGYLYPSRYPAADLPAHVNRLAGWMAKADLNIVQILDFHSLTNTPVWDVYTARPQIDGLFYLEFGDHAADAGATVWSNGKPVIAPRAKLWQGLPGADETTVTNLINAAPRDPTSPAGYSLVVVHVWSKSLADVKTVVDALAPDVRVVTPEALVQLVADNVPHDATIDHDYTGADFQTSELALVGNAFWATDVDPLFSPFPDRLRLTSNGGGQVGSAWWNGTVDPSRSWTTIYRFQISYPALGGADGIAFHVQGDGLGANPGHESGGLSSPHLVVSIDTWNNGPEGTDESLKVILNGSQIYLNDLLDFAPDPNPGSSSNVFRMELTYVAADQELGIHFFDEGGGDALLDTVGGVNLSGFGPSYLGFSAVTGGSSENHDVRTWHFAGAAP